VYKRQREYYESQLWGPAGERARAYLSDRGIDEETARDFGMGYAPAGWRNLLDFMEVKDINAALVERMGLARKKSGHYDAFRDRVMFPVIDIWGHTMAFGGRVLPGDDGPKYINSSETRFYTKGRHLFGLHNAKKGIQREEVAVLVEGNFDVITLHAQGLRHVVAPMGTAFTEDQASLIKRYARKVVIAFDGDSAGEEATAKTLEAMERAGLEAHVVRFAPGDDPDSFVRAQGAEALRDKIAAAPSLVSWSLERVMPQSHQAPIEERLKALEQAGEVLKKVRNTIAWKSYAEELERRLDIEPRLFRQYIREDAKEGKREAIAEQLKRATHPAVSLQKDELWLLVHLLNHPVWLKGFMAHELGNILQSAELAQFITRAAAHYEETGALEGTKVLTLTESEGFREVLLEALSQRSESIAGEQREFPQEKEAQMYADTLERLKVAWADRSIDELMQRQEELSKDFVKNRAQYVEVTAQIQQLQQFRASQGRQAT